MSHLGCTDCNRHTLATPYFIDFLRGLFFWFIIIPISGVLLCISLVLFLPTLGMSTSLLGHLFSELVVYNWHFTYHNDGLD